MHIKEFYDNETATFSYIVADEKTKKAAIIDSVLNYDHFSGKITTKSADEIISYVNSNNFEVEWILETHIHADHLTAANYLKNIFANKPQIAIGEKIIEVLKYWIPVFNLENQVKSDGSQFDKLFKDGEKFKIGSLEVEVLHTPGHTPSCICYKIDKNIFVGDVIFAPDIGSARTDFPGGSAEQSFDSLKKILSFDDDTKLYTAHDYPPANRQLSCVSTILEQKKNNVVINEKITRKEFVEIRQKRDFGKSVPKLLLPSIQVNICIGQLPEKENNGISYIKIPINKF